jgi:Protein of unknown function (DUF2892)
MPERQTAALYSRENLDVSKESFMLKAMFTTRNVGTTDRILRALPSVIVPMLYFAGVISLPLAIGLGVVALMALLTSVLGVCSIYYMLGHSTCPVSGRPNPKGQR